LSIKRNYWKSYEELVSVKLKPWALDFAKQKQLPMALFKYSKQYNFPWFKTVTSALWKLFVLHIRYHNYLGVVKSKKNQSACEYAQPHSQQFTCRSCTCSTAPTTVCDSSDESLLCRVQHLLCLSFHIYFKLVTIWRKVKRVESLGVVGLAANAKSSVCFLVLRLEAVRLTKHRGSWRNEAANLLQYWGHVCYEDETK